jgi:PhzF family phenazine biosynthesis protein
MSARRFAQIDVFTDVPYRGNPVAVVLDAEGIDDADMQRVAQWTNLSETTFVLPPDDPAADYRVRIFTPATELPFAGHPTLGTCHAWLEGGGSPRSGDEIVQQCGAGLVRLRRDPRERRLAFAAPPLRRSGPADDEVVAEACAAMGLDRGAVVAAQWVDNGPPWLALLLPNADAVLSVRPMRTDLYVGLVGLHDDGTPEVRAFFPAGGITVEDPVTGSLNAGLAQWLLETGLLRAPYVAHQGTALGRAGRVHVDRDGDGTVWVGGATLTCVRGTIELAESR